MIEVPVTIRPVAGSLIPPHETTGFAPSQDCPLAVTRIARWGRALWIEGKKWQIVHRPTGHNLRDMTWKTREEAEAILLRCDPNFAAWRLAKGKMTDTATIACFAKFKAAIAPDAP